MEICVVDERSAFLLLKLNGGFAHTSPYPALPCITTPPGKEAITSEKMKWYRALVLLSMCSMLGAALAAQSHECNGHDRGNLSSIISRSLFEQLLKHRGDGDCPGRFYTYEAFVEASKTFSDFATRGDVDARKREVAAFLAQTSFETAGGWPKVYTHAFCLVEQVNKSGNYCVDPQYPCNPSKTYYGRGPFQLTFNYNYRQAGVYLGLDLINNPDLVATDPVISFKAALWGWMVRRWSRPSSHDVMTGQWTPSEADKEAGRLPGFGLTTNIVNGGLACGSGPNQVGKDRIRFYQRYCNALEVSEGNNVDCYNQEPFRGGGQCGLQGGGAVCPGRLCCSQWGFCGTSDQFCGTGCQSHCGGAGTITLPIDI